MKAMDFPKLLGNVILHLTQESITEPKTTEISIQPRDIQNHSLKNY